MGLDWIHHWVCNIIFSQFHLGLCKVSFTIRALPKVLFLFRDLHQFMKTLFNKETKFNWNLFSNR